MRQLIIINGPNLNMLGIREPDLYGHQTLENIINITNEKSSCLDVKVEWFQSNHEGQLIDIIQRIYKNNIDGLIINPGAYAHTSVAIFDALTILNCPIVEVHLTNTHAREHFRHRKLTAKAATMIMEGFGPNVYYFAIQLLLQNIEEGNHGQRITDN